MSPLANHFGDHLNELRRRVAISLGTLLLCAVFAYFFSEQIAQFLIVPLFRASPELKGLVYTNLTEAFISYLKISVMVGVIAAFPVVLYQVWAFVSPGLHKHEKKSSSCRCVLGQLTVWLGCGLCLCCCHAPGFNFLDEFCQ